MLLYVAQLLYFLTDIEQAERGAIRNSPQAHKHFCPLIPKTAMVLYHTGLY
jgi:hypothetical protein